MWSRKLIAIVSFCAVAVVGYVPLMAVAANKPVFAGVEEFSFGFWPLVSGILLASLLAAVVVAVFIRWRMLRVTAVLALSGAAIVWIYSVYELPRRDDNAELFVGIMLFIVGPQLGAIALQIIWPKADHS